VHWIGTSKVLTWKWKRGSAEESERVFVESNMQDEGVSESLTSGIVISIETKNI
jgi:hypothetical protein